MFWGGRVLCAAGRMSAQGPGCMMWARGDLIFHRPAGRARRASSSSSCRRARPRGSKVARPRLSSGTAKPAGRRRGPLPPFPPLPPGGGTGSNLSTWTCPVHVEGACSCCSGMLGGSASVPGRTITPHPPKPTPPAAPPPAPPVGWAGLGIAAAAMLVEVLKSSFQSLRPRQVNARAHAQSSTETAA